MLGATIGLLMIQAAQAAVADSAGIDPLSVFSGDWQIIDAASGEVIQDCSKAQVFAVAPDRKTVLLTEKTVDDWASRYMVVRGEKNRVLMFIEDEERTTESGDPILWWANFDGPDTFRWRRYDWAPDNRTTSEWRRCPAA